MRLKLKLPRNENEAREAGPIETQIARERALEREREKVTIMRAATQERAPIRHHKLRVGRKQWMGASGVSGVPIVWEPMRLRLRLLSQEFRKKIYALTRRFLPLGRW